MSSYFFFLLIIIFIINYYRQPMITGTSIIAFKYKDGIMMGSDMLGKVFTYISIFFIILKCICNLIINNNLYFILFRFLWFFG